MLKMLMCVGEVLREVVKIRTNQTCKMECFLESLSEETS